MASNCCCPKVHCLQILSRERSLAKLVWLGRRCLAIYGQLLVWSDAACCIVYNGYCASMQMFINKASDYLNFFYWAKGAHHNTVQQHYKQPNKKAKLYWIKSTSIYHRQIKIKCYVKSTYLKRQAKNITSKQSRHWDT